MTSVMACTSFGMQLARFDSEVEQSYFLTAAKSILPNNTYWLAGNDIIIDGIWRWASDDTLINMKLGWAVGQPGNDGGRRENCMTIYCKDFLLHDVYCKNIHQYICQRVFEN